MVNDKVGDDLFDAACAAVYALLTRGLADAPTVISQRKVSRDEMRCGRHGSGVPRKTKEESAISQ